MDIKHIKLAIIGLGYVGLPLAVEFGRTRFVVGFDINQLRVEKVMACNDFTLDTTSGQLCAAKFF